MSEREKKIARIYLIIGLTVGFSFGLLVAKSAYYM